MTVTAQSIFDKTLAHLRQQGRAAINEVGSCRYRGPDNTMCAVGCHTPDDKYNPILEGVSASGELVLAALPDGYSQHEVLLEELQRAHDYHLGDSDGYGDKFQEQLRLDWENEMQHIAKAHNLTFTPLTN